MDKSNGKSQLTRNDNNVLARIITSILENTINNWQWFPLVRTITNIPTEHQGHQCLVCFYYFRLCSKDTADQWRSKIPGRLFKTFAAPHLKAFLSFRQMDYRYWDACLVSRPWTCFVNIYSKVFGTWWNLNITISYIFTTDDTFNSKNNGSDFFLTGKALITHVFGLIQFAVCIQLILKLPYNIVGVGLNILFVKSSTKCIMERSNCLTIFLQEKHK